MPEHHFVNEDADEMVVVPRETTRREHELLQWSNFRVHHLVDPVVEAEGHAIDSRYVETFWLPLIGPTSYCMARNLLARDDGSIVVLEQLSAELGCKSAAGFRTIERLERFGIVRRQFGVGLSVRRMLAPLSLSQFGRLPGHIRVLHSSFDRDAR